MVKQANKRALARILSLVMVLSLMLGALLGLTTTTYARTMSQMQDLVLKTLALSTTDRTTVINAIGDLSNGTNGATIELTAPIIYNLLKSQSAMSSDDVTQALNIFMGLDKTTKRDKLVKILNDTKSVNFSGYPVPTKTSLQGIKRDINNFITGDPNNNLGIQFLMQGMVLVSPTVIVTGQKLATDDPNNSSKIYLNRLTSFDSYKDSMNVLISNISDMPSGYPKTFDGMIAYAESLVNGKTSSEINAFKDYLEDELGKTIVYFDSRHQGGGGGGGGGGGSDSTPAPTPAPTTSSTPAPTTSATPTATTAPTTTPVPTSTPAPVVTPPPQVVAAVSTVKEEAAKMDSMTATEAAAKAQEIITKAIDVVKTTEQQGQSAQEVKTAVVQVAEKVMAKVNEEKVEAKVEGTKATVAIQATEVEKYIEKVNTIATTASDLNKKLAEVSSDAKVESVLVVKVDTQPEVKEVQAEVPTALLKAALDKELDKVAIDTGVAKIAISPDAISSGDATSVSLGAKVIANADLTQSVKDKVGDSPVFDFNASAGGNKVSNFNKPVEITVPFTMKEGEDPKKITVFYINDKGELENVIGNYDATTKSVKFTTSHFSQYVVKMNDVRFTDIASVDWAIEGIEVMASKGIINGVGGGEFDPDANITRAQFAAMVARANKLTDTATTVKFKDVRDSDWFSKEVYAAAKAGLIQGKEDGSFAPNESITRQDMAVIMSRALVNLKGKTIGASDVAVSKYADKGSIASYATNAVDACVRLSVMKGMSETEFAPEEQATRAQVAVIMYRMFYLK